MKKTQPKISKKKARVVSEDVVARLEKMAAQIQLEALGELKAPTASYGPTHSQIFSKRLQTRLKP